MKLKASTVAGASMEVTVPDDANGEQLKKALEEEHQYDSKGLKVVFKGKVVGDGDKLMDLGLVENEKIMVVGKKAPPKPKPEPTPEPKPAAAAEGTPTEKKEGGEEKKEEKKEEGDKKEGEGKEEKPAEAAAPAAAAPIQPGGAEGTSFMTGDALASAATELEAISGRTNQECMAALRASFNNPDRAFEILMSGGPIPAAGGMGAGAQMFGMPGMAGLAGLPGMPDLGAMGQAEAEQAVEQLLEGADAMEEGEESEGDGEGSDGDENAPLPEGTAELVDALRSVENFEQIRTLIASNPAMLPAVLTQLQQTNPQLHQLLQDNNEAFRHIMEHGLDSVEEMGEDGDEGEVIELNEADKAALERLETLGFGREECVQAYIACDKNEELAANFLFDNGMMG